MDLKQARFIVEDTRKAQTLSYGNRIRDLCDVIEFLLDEIERIRTPIMTVLPKRLDPHKPIHTLPHGPRPDDRPIKSRPINPPHPNRKGNAGDAT